MFRSENFSIKDRETAEFRLPTDRDFKILQLTDSHFGFGFMSKMEDRKAMAAIRTLTEQTKPDLIVFTGDMIFPFLPKSGTLDNRLQAHRFMAFMDTLDTPYAIIFGNHDTEQMATCNRKELLKVFQEGQNSIMLAGPDDIAGEGNYFINLIYNDKPVMSLVMLDAGLYNKGSFFSGFAGIQKDQTEWVMNKLDFMRKINPKLEAMAFFHVPLPEYKEAYAKMKIGRPEVKYNFGSVSEVNEYFGIPTKPGTFFDAAVKNGAIKWMFCGHDHLNNISMTYKGIRLTYGLSIDYMSYRKILQKVTQRGGTLITRHRNGTVAIEPVHYGPVVSGEIRGINRRMF